MISGFRHEVDENDALLGYYTVSSGNFFLTFWDILISPIFWGLGAIGCPEMSVRNYRYTLLNNPEERSSHIN
jgi:hypothetical protein